MSARFDNSTEVPAPVTVEVWVYHDGENAIIKMRDGREITVKPYQWVGLPAPATPVGPEETEKPQ